MLVELLQLSKITTTAFSTSTSAEVLSTTSSLTFRVVYTLAAEHFIDQRAMSVAHPQGRGGSGVSGNDSDRASDSSEVLEPFMLSLQLLLHAAAVAVAANNNFAAIGATIVTAVAAAAATACLRFAAVSTAVRSCCSDMLLCLCMLRLLPLFFFHSCCSCLHPEELSRCLVSSHIRHEHLMF